MTHNQSPFPGMDPYLEGNDLWQEFHDTLAHEIRRQLQTVLSSKYVALLKKWYTTVTPDVIGLLAPPERSFYPDVHVTKTGHTGSDVRLTTQAAVAQKPVLVLTSPLPGELPLLAIEIQDVAQRRLVTMIEILSPVNKIGQGFQEYFQKRLNTLQTQTHLLEIDLLRAGQRLPLLGGPLPAAPYFIFLSRFTHRPQTEVWPVGLREQLPVVPVPLLPPDPDVSLDLQAAIDHCFELVGYQRLLDYTAPPPPPAFSKEDASWLQAQIGLYSIP